MYRLSVQLKGCSRNRSGTGLTLKGYCGGRQQHMVMLGYSREPVSLVLPLKHLRPAKPNATSSNLDISLRDRSGHNYVVAYLRVSACGAYERVHPPPATTHTASTIYSYNIIKIKR